MPCFNKRREAFTLIEILLALTTFTLVIGGYSMFMSTQNRQVTTITQHSQANEAATLIVQAMSFDLKSAKRGDILSGSESNPIVVPCVTIAPDGKSVSIIRAIESTESKKSDQLFLEKVEYSFNELKKEVNKKVFKMEFVKAAKTPDGKKVYSLFNFGGIKLSKVYKNITSLKLKSVPIRGKEKTNHTLGVGIEAEARLDNNLIAQDQIGKSRSIIFISDEVAYKNQPSWNVNPVFSNSFVNVTLSPPITLDFSSALDIIKWAKNFKDLIPGLIDDAKQQIFDKVMIGLTGKVLERAEALYSKFINDAQISSMINSVKSDFIKMVKDAANDPKLCTAAAILSDALYNGNAGEIIKNKIIGKALAEADIDAMMEKYGQKLIDAGSISSEQYRKFITFRDVSKKLEGEIAGTQAEYTAIVDKLRNQIYSALPGEEKISEMVNSYAVALSDKLKAALKGDILASVGSQVVSQVVEEKAVEVAELVIDSSGLQSVFSDSKLDDAGKAILNEVLDSLKGGIKALVGNIATDVGRKIILGGQQIVFKSKEEAFAKAAECMPDAVNSTIALLSKKFLVAEKWDGAAKKFIANPGATNYLKKLFDGFNMQLPSFDADKEARAALDQFYAENNLPNPL